VKVDAFIPVMVGAIAVSGLTGCSKRPAPTSDEITKQAKVIAAECVQDTGDRCTQLRQTLCDDLEAFIDEKGESITPQKEFGKAWSTVSLASLSCNNLKTGY
jgi:hypothetical protein